MSEACRCWRDTYALGHEGHCCFVHGDRKRNNGFKDDEAVCHVTAGIALATTTEAASTSARAEQAEGETA